MPCTRRPCASAGLASTSILASTQEPAPSVASRSSTGESCLHGSHHSAHRSSTTGTWKERSSTSAWKVASVTSTTALPGAPAGASTLGGGAAWARAAASERAFTAARSTAPASEAAIWACCACARGSGRPERVGCMYPLSPSGLQPRPGGVPTCVEPLPALLTGPFGPASSGRLAGRLPVAMSFEHHYLLERGPVL